MAESSWSEADSARALEVWADYGRHNEVVGLSGLTVGIDPIGGRLWFGRSASDVARMRDAEGIDSPLYCLRVGHDHYLRKGGRR